ncbi:MAG: hypothetical protein QXO75_05380, partial [Nitrososphaerota archaeon]
ENLPLHFNWLYGSKHLIEIPTIIQTQPKIRYVFKGWNDGETSEKKIVIVSSSTSFIAKYEVEYLVSISSPYGTSSGGGWYKAGTNATLSISPTIIDFGNKTRLIFERWTGDLTSENTSLTVEIKSPIALNANWKTQYYLNIVSPYEKTISSG